MRYLSVDVEDALFWQNEQKSDTGAAICQQQMTVQTTATWGRQLGMGVVPGQAVSVFEAKKQALVLGRPV